MYIVINNVETDLFPILLGVLALVALVLMWVKRSISYGIFVAIFGFYLIMAAKETLFQIPIYFSGDSADMMREAQTSFSFSVFDNLVPFNFDFSELPEIVFRQIYQNILLTIPFGFGVSFIARLRPKDFLWLIPVAGAATEAAQLLLSLILRYRFNTVDINDVILNTLGVLIGYGLFRLFAWLYVGATKFTGIQHWGLSAYIYDVASRTSTPSPATPTP